jgi:hypothetical protein
MCRCNSTNLHNSVENCGKLRIMLASITIHQVANSIRSLTEWQLKPCFGSEIVIPNSKRLTIPKSRCKIWCIRFGKLHQFQRHNNCHGTWFTILGMPLSHISEGSWKTNAHNLVGLRFFANRSDPLYWLQISSPVLHL